MDHSLFQIADLKKTTRVLKLLMKLLNVFGFQTKLIDYSSGKAIDPDDVHGAGIVYLHLDMGGQTAAFKMQLEEE